MEEITARNLRKRGWTIFFRDGFVIAQKGEVFNHALRIPNGNGEWMRKIEDPGNFEVFDLTGEQKLELDAIKKLCYCSQLTGGNCDFCSGVRREELKREMTPPSQRPLLGDYPVKLPRWSPPDNDRLEIGDDTLLRKLF